MKHTRTLRTRAGLAVSVILASGAAVVGTAGEAAAASACNTTSISSMSFIGALRDGAPTARTAM